MAAREDDAASKRKAEEAEEDDDSTPEAADQMADETVSGPAAAAEVDGCSDDDGDEDDSFIRNLNLISKRNLMPVEWVENARKLHYEQVASYHRAYDALESGDLESDDEAGTAEYEEWSKQLWASVRLRGLNIGSRGVDAVAVPFRLNPPEEEGEEEKDQDAAAQSST